MAIVQGIRERVHAPLYDSIKVDPEKQLRDEESSGTLRFFVNVQNKNKLETNLQSASLHSEIESKRAGFIHNIAYICSADLGSCLV